MPGRLGSSYCTRRIGPGTARPMRQEDVMVADRAAGLVGVIGDDGVDVVQCERRPGGTSPSSPPHVSEIVAPTFGSGHGRSSSTLTSP